MQMSACLLYEEALELLMSSRYRVCDAALAPPPLPTAAVGRELGEAVARAFPDLDGSRACRRRWPSARSPEQLRRGHPIFGHKRMFATSSDASSRLPAGAWPEGRAADF